MSSAKTVAFSPLIFVAGTKLLARRGGPIGSFRDLTGKTLVVTSGTTNEKAMRALNDKYKLGISIVAAPDHDASSRDAGRRQGRVTPSPPTTCC